MDLVSTHSWLGLSLLWGKASEELPQTRSGCRALGSGLGVPGFGAPLRKNFCHDLEMY